MAKKIITVFGATGAQGNSVVQIFLNDSKLKDQWRVRAVTRDVSKESAQKLVSQGAEIVAANLDDKASLIKAMKGAHTVYGMTNYWDTIDKDTEIRQGKDLADAAKETGVQHYIWSSLLNVTELSKGVLPHVYHFDSKALVEDYIREIGVPYTAFLPGFYMSNISRGMLTQIPPNPYTLALPIPSSAPLPLIDIDADLGKFIKGIVLHRDTVLGKQILGATAYVPGQEVVDVFKRLYPQDAADARYAELPHDTFREMIGSTFGLAARGDQAKLKIIQDEMLENLRLMSEFGYYGGAELEESHSILDDKLTMWEDHARNAPAWAHLKRAA